MFRKALCAAVLLTAAPVMAADISYNYVQLDYSWITLEDVLPNIDIDGDGPGISGSAELGELWFIEAGYRTTDFESSVDVDQASIGFGIHSEMTANSDFFVSLSYLNVDATDSDGDSVSEDGYEIALGVRGMVTDNFELDGILSYADLGGGADNTTLGALGIYNFTDVFSAGVSIEFEDDSFAYGAGVRLYWGK